MFSINFILILSFLSFSIIGKVYLRQTQVVEEVLTPNAEEITHSIISGLLNDVDHCRSTTTIIITITIIASNTMCAVVVFVEKPRWKTVERGDSYLAEAAVLAVLSFLTR